MYAVRFQCAGCGEWVETTVDESAGSKQQYVEDCQVCCQPNVLTVRWDGTAQEFSISSELESKTWLRCLCASDSSKIERS